MSDVLLTVKEYAELFRVTENAVYIAIRKGRFPHPVERPLGGALRIRFSVVGQFELENSSH